MKIYSINTNSYEPVSFEKSYLYNQYDKIQSFLIKNYGIKYKEVLAKPIISDEQVLWHGNFQNKLNRISEYPEDIQNTIKQEYWLLINYVNDEINKLAIAKDPEKQSWGKLLREVFNDENNIILTDGNEWCLLWGWKFRNNQENYLPPVFKTKSEEIATNNFGTGMPTPFIPEIVNSANTLLAENATKEEESTSKKTIKAGGSGWLSFLHALRYFVYRFWGLLFFIMFLLLIATMFKSCNNAACNNCNNLDSLNSKILELQKKAAERCR